MKKVKMKKYFTFILILTFALPFQVFCQYNFIAEGNGLFTSPASTNLDIKNTDNNTNALVRFGDNNLSKVSIGYSGDQGNFKVSTAATLGVDDLTMGLTGLIGINQVPGNHRVLINHNSTSGTGGSAHLTLQENNTGDFSRLRFENLGTDDYWTFDTRATDGDALLNIFYNDGLNDANLMSFDGDQFKVGIHQEIPEAYLHIRQQFAGVDALAFVNDNDGGSDKWSMRIGDEDILIYYNSDIRGGFDVSTGNYNNFPPSLNKSFSAGNYSQPQIIDQLLKIQIELIELPGSNNQEIFISPEKLAEVNPNWIKIVNDKKEVDYQVMNIELIQAIKNRQQSIQHNEKIIERLKVSTAEFKNKILTLEAQIDVIAGIE